MLDNDPNPDPNGEYVGGSNHENVEAAIAKTWVPLVDIPLVNPHMYGNPYSAQMKFICAFSIWTQQGRWHYGDFSGRIDLIRVSKFVEAQRASYNRHFSVDVKKMETIKMSIDWYWVSNGSNKKIAPNQASL